MPSSLSIPKRKNHQHNNNACSFVVIRRKSEATSKKKIYKKLYCIVNCFAASATDLELDYKVN